MLECKNVWYGEITREVTLLYTEVFQSSRERVDLDPGVAATDSLFVFVHVPGGAGPGAGGKHPGVSWAQIALTAWGDGNLSSPGDFLLSSKKATERAFCEMVYYFVNFRN